ncbi:MAG: alanine dehydrogenase [Actinomycetota bacterium]|nr:alanine dehydrogenase [Actinomycetota bacterium]
MHATSVGIPAETKDGERRVVLEPHAVHALVTGGSSVVVERGAGVGAGFDDRAYEAAGAQIADTAAQVWASDVVVKVKEPQPSEWGFFRPDLTLFCYLHLAAEPNLTAELVRSGVRAYAFETLTDPDGGLPLLAPMSEVAGRAAAIIGAARLAEGSGTLAGGAAGVPPARVAVIGLGVAGAMAARGARGLDAEVTGIDIDLGRLRDHHRSGTVTSTLASSPGAVAEAVAEADLVIGAALVPGAKAPTIVTAEAVAAMRPGSVVVDLAIDQGGCIETARPTSLSEPTYVVSGVVHYCVTNVPGQYPRTSSRALSAAVAPRLADLVCDADAPSLQGALNVADGAIVHPAVAAAVGPIGTVAA